MNIYILFWNIFNNIDFYLMSGFIMVFFTLLLANYYDLKYGIIPNKLSVFLMTFGILINVLILIVLNNRLYAIFYVSYLIIIFIISFVLWKISFWGGGDLKLFCSIGFSLPFIDILNHFYTGSILNSFSFNSQIILYPKIFSILINSILLSFPVILFLLVYKLLRENKLNLILFAFSNMKLLIKELSTKTVFINNLKEGMIVEDYYFNSLELFNLIKELTGNEECYNLKASQFKENSYVLKSSSMAGLTRDDIKLINFAYKETLINFPNFKIKMGVPFVPSLTVGYLVFLAFGDLVFLISTII